MGLVDPIGPEPVFRVPSEVLRYFAIWYVCYLCDTRMASLVGCLAHLWDAHRVDITARNMRETEP
jgi:hypothetical protein